MSTNTQNEMMFISVDKLHPHKDNPRKNVGDVTELAESIKTNGILQNLTVVPSENSENEYTVIIGHRRLAAAKQAGLTEVPCIVREMSEKEQISTMLLENMQRSDLTPYEQAQGIQMMLDLGETVESVSEKTGFSRGTIRRRTRLLTLDSDAFKRSESRQVTLGEYDRLFEVKDEKQRNALLKDIGTANFNDKLERAKQQEKRAEERKEIFDLLDKIAKPIGEKDRSDMIYCGSVYNLDEAKKFIDNKPDGELFYVPSDYNIWIYRNRTIEEIKELDEKKKAEELKEQEKEALRAKLNALRAHYHKLRYNFVVNGGIGVKSNLPVINEMLVKGALSDNYYIRVDREKLLGMLGFELKESDNEDCNKSENSERYLSEMQEKYPERVALYIGYLMFDDDERNGYHSYYELEYSDNNKLNTLYCILEKLGYERSDEEKAYCDGTHELFCKEK